MGIANDVNVQLVFIIISVSSYLLEGTRRSAVLSSRKHPLFLLRDKRYELSRTNWCSRKRRIIVRFQGLSDNKRAKAYALLVANPTTWCPEH